MLFIVHESHCFVSIPPTFAQRLLHNGKDVKIPVILKLVFQAVNLENAASCNVKYTNTTQLYSKPNNELSLCDAYVSWGGGTSDTMDELNVCSLVLRLNTFMNDSFKSNNLCTICEIYICLHMYTLFEGK